MAGMEIRAAGPGADIRRMDDRVLVKMALERKSFQQARKEVADETARFDSPPGASAVEVDVLHVHGVQVQIHAQEGQTTVDVLEMDLEAVRARVRKVEPKRKDPLVLDLSGEGPHTTGASGAQAFDLQGNGSTAPTSFVTGGTAFLALDRNGNRRIDSGAELFGDQHGAADGFAELAKFDANGDGRIDASDPVFGQLQLVFGDGHQESLASAGISAIDLGSAKGYELANGDAVLRQGSAYRTDGSRMGAYAMGLQQFEA